MATRRILVSAGDPSGDLILSHIVEALRKLSPEPLEFEGLAGPQSAAAGVKLLAESSDVAVVGIWEVLARLRTIFGVLARLEARLPEVDSLLCVDFPDFNLKLAKMAQARGRPVDYVVAPQVWAWRGGRMPLIRRLVRRLYPALPFEEELFVDAGVSAKFMGHPLRDDLPPRNRMGAREEMGLARDASLLAVLPGSRIGEIQRHLPLLLDTWEQFRVLRRRRVLKGEWKALLPLAPGWDEPKFFGILKAPDAERLRALLASGEWVLARDSRRVLMAADFGWVASGTATLEAAYYQLPHILFYRLSGFSAFLIRRMSRYFTEEGGSAGLPNILLGRPVIPELLQDDLSPTRLAAESVELLTDPVRMNTLRKSLRFVPKKLGEVGVAERIAADLLAVWKRPT